MSTTQCLQFARCFGLLLSYLAVGGHSLTPIRECWKAYSVRGIRASSEAFACRDSGDASLRTTGVSRRRVRQLVGLGTMDCGGEVVTAPYISVSPDGHWIGVLLRRTQAPGHTTELWVVENHDGAQPLRLGMCA